MRVFISHDFDDKDKFEELSEALRQRGATLAGFCPVSPGNAVAISVMPPMLFM